MVFFKWLAWFFAQITTSGSSRFGEFRFGESRFGEGEE